MQTIIGGMFGLEVVGGESRSDGMPPFLQGPHILAVNARSCLLLLVEHLSPPQIWMPSYLCGTVLQAIDGHTTDLRFFEVNYDLAVQSADWVDEIRQGDLVVFIDYFGFPYDSSYAMRAKAQGAWVLEDASQALLSKHVGHSSDFVLYSPRKFLGVPDGGILSINCDVHIPDNILHFPPERWWLEAFRAAVLRREFDIHNTDRQWFTLFQQIELEYPTGYYAMSELTRILLTHSFDYTAISQQRIDNYQFLSNHLGHLAIFPKLAPSVVPLGFPIRTESRDRLRLGLFDRRIYPPVHWPIQDIVPNRFRDSHHLAANILTLPCDQRYEQADMERLARTVQAILG